METNFLLPHRVAQSLPPVMSWQITFKSGTDAMIILPVVCRTRIFVAGIKGDVDRE